MFSNDNPFDNLIRPSIHNDIVRHTPHNWLQAVQLFQGLVLNDIMKN